jgi:hypothetical protein
MKQSMEVAVFLKTLFVKHFSKENENVKHFQMNMNLLMRNVFHETMVNDVCFDGYDNISGDSHICDNNDDCMIGMKIESVKIVFLE